MTAHRHLRAAALAGTALATYVAVARPRLSSAGATRAECTARWPGDDLIPGARTSTMATTLAAPPDAVWPWLVQMGADRAGFYSWDRLDNGGRASADRIHPEWQRLSAGDRIASVPDGRSWFDVARLEPERTLVLRASLRLPRAEPFDPAGEEPRAYSDSIWAFHLRPTDDGGTRLVVRGAGRGRPRWLTRFADVAFWEPAHWIMQTRQFRGIRRRCEVDAGQS